MEWRLRSKALELPFESSEAQRLYTTRQMSLLARVNPESSRAVALSWISVTKLLNTHADSAICTRT